MLEAVGGSRATTRGIRVTVESRWLEHESRPDPGPGDDPVYTFAYAIEITNESDHTVQLLRRRWTITDGHGREERVAGPGVIGQQPVLRPGESFLYGSGCPLRTPIGAMRGAYEFVLLGEGAEPALGQAEAAGDQAGDGAPPGERFWAEVAEFSLVVPHALH